MNPRKIKFYHLRLLSPEREGYAALTLAIDDDRSSFGYALCSPRDQFSRKHGRGEALRRLVTEERTLPKDAMTFEQVASAVARILHEKPAGWLQHYRMWQPWRTNAQAFVG